jgi:hypothetical protein
VIQMRTIAPEHQEDALASFWTMLQECESKADDSGSALLKNWVSQWYEQWNRMTGDDKKPRWARA